MSDDTIPRPRLDGMVVDGEVWVSLAALTRELRRGADWHTGQAADVDVGCAHGYIAAAVHHGVAAHLADSADQLDLGGIALRTSDAEEKGGAGG